MPINGLSNKKIAFPSIGKIRKGAKKRINKEGKEIFGEELTYFRVEFEEGEQESARHFESIYGKTPNAIRVLFPFDEISRFWDPWKTAFVAGTMLGRSDGDFIDFLQDNKGNILVKDGLDREGKRVPHPADNIAGYDYKNQPVKFKNSGVLKVLIYEIPRAEYMEVITNSTNDIANISSQLEAFKQLNGGKIAGIPFIIRRVPRMISTPNGEGKPKVRRKKYLISIAVDEEWIRRKFGQLRVLALPEFEGEEIIAGELPANASSVETDFDEGELDPETPAQPEEPAFMKDEPEKLPDVKMVYPLGSEAVAFAAKKWNCTAQQALEGLQKKNLGKMIAWDDLVQIVDPQPETVGK